MLALAWCAALGLVVAERTLIRPSTRYFTPATAVLAATAMVYLLPLTLVSLGVSNRDFYLSRADDHDQAALVLAVLLFVCTCLLSLVAAAPLVRTRIRAVAHFQLPQADPRLLIFVGLVATAIWVLQLALTGGLSPAEMLDRAMNPREYTGTRAGTGYLTVLRLGSGPLFLALAALNFVNPARQKSRRIGLLLWAITISVLGGNKTAFISVVVFVGVAAEWRWRAKEASSSSPRRPLATSALRGAIILVVGASSLYGAFAFMTTESLAERGVSPIAHMVGYPREAYNTTRVLRDFDWSSEYLVSGVIDVPISAVPSALAPTIGETGFYDRYWRPAYEPRSAAFHASTYGHLAEGHMMFGFLGPVVHGLLFTGLMLVAYWLLERPRTLLRVFLASWLWYRFYFFARAGLTGSVASTGMLTVAVAALVLKVEQVWDKSTKRRSSGRDHRPSELRESGPYG